MPAPAEEVKYLMEAGVPGIFSSMLRQLSQSDPRPTDPKTFFMQLLQKQLGREEPRPLPISVGEEGLWLTPDSILRRVDRAVVPPHEIELLDADYSVLHMIAMLRKDTPNLLFQLMSDPRVNVFQPFRSRTMMFTAPSVYDCCRMLNNQAARRIKIPADFSSDAPRPLILAGEGNLEELKKLPQTEVQEAYSPFFLTALHCAAANGHLACVEWLVEGVGLNTGDSAKLHDFGTTAMLLAMEGGHLPVCSYLLSKGADIPITALDYLLSRPPLFPVIKWLVTKGGVSPQSRDAFYTGGLVTQAAMADRLEVIQWAIDNGLSSIDEGKSNGKSLVFRAANGGALTVLRWLAEEKGEEVVTGDGQQRPPLILAARNGHLPEENLPTVKFLMTKGGTALQEKDKAKIASSGCPGIVQWMTEQGYLKAQ
eukprot:TRINITY_DN46928_c0_g1_i1.p1 TRINITY_DN46928_c0_g1~~TRINITY_DN46928_c0_g1_i1.p1  ORF type:complete len:424 (+),score=20.26 TRINITY_DN46928_c0_g1_i1:27-1298(+)